MNFQMQVFKPRKALNNTKAGGLDGRAKIIFLNYSRTRPGSFQNQLFQDFNTTKQEGSGIGLAFCKFTMQSFGGDISATCDEGGCIEFVLSFSLIP